MITFQTEFSVSDLVLDNKKQLKTVKTKKTKGGRPKKEDAERLSKKITVNFSEDELDLLARAAEPMPIATFIRMTLKDRGLI